VGGFGGFARPRSASSIYQPDGRQAISTGSRTHRISKCGWSTRSLLKLADLDWLVVQSVVR
jgi:hypothetical protein